MQLKETINDQLPEFGTVSHYKWAFDGSGHFPGLVSTSVRLQSDMNNYPTYCGKEELVSLAFLWIFLKSYKFVFQPDNLGQMVRPGRFI
jgi:hypothetical protein